MRLAPLPSSGQPPLAPVNDRFAAISSVASNGLTEAAASITVPVEFLLQWNDEAVPLESGLALFDAFASAEKTLHANAGLHRDVPLFEVDSSARFFARHLLGGA
jgi:fermentation-respiration switch protein FrsA (DUF1100 family)